MAFFQDKENGSEEGTTNQLDITTVPARTLNQATSSGMSWADTVKLLTPSTATINNNVSSTTTTVNQQINQIVLNQNTKKNETDKTSTSTVQSIAMNQSTTSNKNQQTSTVSKTTEGMPPDIQGLELTISFQEKMMALQKTIQKNEKESEDKLALLGNTISALVTSSNRRLTQVQTINQIQTNACMMGIQELAAKMNLQIVSPMELVNCAKEEFCQQEATIENQVDSPDLTEINNAKENELIESTTEVKEQDGDKMDVANEEVSQVTPSSTQEVQSQQSIQSQQSQQQLSQQLLTQISPPVGSSEDGNF